MAVEDRDMGWGRIKAQLKDFDKLSLTVGIHKGQSKQGALSTAAAANEYGRKDGHIKERPAWRMAFDANGNKYKQMVGDAVGHVERSGAAPRLALMAVGVEVRNDLIKSIVALSEPENKPSTIAKKGSSNPLVDTAATQRAITAKVRKGVKL